MCNPAVHGLDTSLPMACNYPEDSEVGQVGPRAGQISRSHMGRLVVQMRESAGWFEVDLYPAGVVHGAAGGKGPVGVWRYE